MYSIESIKIYFENESFLHLTVEEEKCKYFTTDYRGDFFVIGSYQKDGSMLERAFPSGVIDRISIIRKIDKQRMHKSK